MPHPPQPSNDLGISDSRCRLRAGHGLDLCADGAGAGHHLQRHAHAELRAGRDADGFDVHRLDRAARARLAARGVRRRRRRRGGADGMGDRAAADPARGVGHSLGRAHHHAGPVVDPALAGRAAVDARRVSVPVVLRHAAGGARARAGGAGVARDHRRLARADDGARRALPLDAPGTRDARGGAEPARGPADGHQRRACVRDLVGARRRRRGRRRCPRRAGGVPLFEDGAHRHQRLHRGRGGRLRLDAGRGGRWDAARRDREPRAALPAVRHPLLGAVPRAHRDSRRASGRAARPGGAEEGLRRAALVIASAVLVASWPWVAPRYFVFLASLIFVNVVVALGLNLLSGYTNQLSFGHAGFLAIGAYTAALTAIHAPRVPVVLTRTGRAFLALRESVIAAEASGVPVAAYKTLAFGVSAFYTGVAGGLFAFVVGFLSPDAFDVFLSVDFVVMIIVGGLGSVPGSIVGAAIVTVLHDSLAASQNYRQLIFGVILIACMRFMPG